MEAELRCSVCSDYYRQPVILACTHSVCMECGMRTQGPAQQFLQSDDGPGGGTGLAEDYPDIDKLSILSETDSGVVCTSRPNSYVGTPGVGSMLTQVLQPNATGLSCAKCKKVTYMDESGVAGLPINRVLDLIVNKYTASKNDGLGVSRCQLCEGEARQAAVFCEQCEVYYCDGCRESCHPPRGPLAKHNLVPSKKGGDTLRAKNKVKESKCTEHTDENINMYCMSCKNGVCYLCLQDGRHASHDVQALGAMCKAQKTELSHNLQALSEKARQGTEYIQRLKSLSEKVQENTLEFEAMVVAQCDAIVEAIKARKERLIRIIEEEKDSKIRTFRDQVQHCTGVLQRTTGLLQFSIEVLKESDNVSFMQVSGGLIDRVSNSELSFNGDMELGEPRTSHDFLLTLDNRPIMSCIENLNFFQNKVPGPPTMTQEDCSAENNSVTIAWQPYPGSHVEEYILELDDGNAGPFREVYCGRQTICAVEGLHFDSIYNARVKALNPVGQGEYSDCISMQTAEVAWFSLDQITAHPDIIFSNDDTTVACNSYDERVVLGTVGLSKGVHYWEVIIDRYENHPDPAFGVSRFDCLKDVVLGKDDKSWSMYIDAQRSWFMHDNDHFDRTEGGIERGSRVGVLLDLNKHTLSYFVNDEAQGPIAFTGLHGVFFPAISLNRNCQVTIHTGLDPPSEVEEEQ